MTARRPVRAVLASEFWPGATARGLVPGLRQARWLVEELDVRAYLPVAHTLASKVEARIRRRSRLSAFQAAILATTDRIGAEVFLTVKGYAIHAATLDALRDRGVLTVNYYPDAFFSNVPLDLVRRYDTVVTTKSYHVDALRAAMKPDAVEFLHHGYSEGVHRPVGPDETAPGVDLLYVGNAALEKTALMIDLARALPDLRIRVVGQGWSSVAVGTPLEKAVVGAVLSGDYYAQDHAAHRQCRDTLAL